MGQQITNMLERCSGVSGVEVPGAGPATAALGGDADSDDDSEEEDEVEGGHDVLGLEEDPEISSDDEDADHEIGEQSGAGGEFRDYMAELDEHLEAMLDAPNAARASAGCDDGLPLNSHHVKVHDNEPLELDLHTMEHLLASFCSEHQLEPGPASLLLGELGLGAPATKGYGSETLSAAASRRTTQKSTGAGHIPCVVGAAPLDAMD